MAVEWRSDDSAFDRHLRGEATLEGAAARGMALFYGAAGCAACHSGAFQTDHGFHATGVPQFGPGKAARFESHRRDLGRARVTGRDADPYPIRTPSLLNLTLTAPNGHTGSHADLGAFVAHHADPGVGFDPAAVRLVDVPGRAPLEGLDQAEVLAAVARPAVSLEAAQLADLVAFLGSLTGDLAVTGRLGVPAAVPSGLPVEQ
ncbi:MAG: cytochrome-c peroxidase, partial [Pseudomonadota bacterium]